MCVQPVKYLLVWSLVMSIAALLSIFYFFFSNVVYWTKLVERWTASEIEKSGLSGFFFLIAHCLNRAMEYWNKKNWKLSQNNCISPFQDTWTFFLGKYLSNLLFRMCRINSFGVFISRLFSVQKRVFLKWTYVVVWLDLSLSKLFIDELLCADVH